MDARFVFGSGNRRLVFNKEEYDILGMAQNKIANIVKQSVKNGRLDITEYNKRITTYLEDMAKVNKYNA